MCYTITLAQYAKCYMLNINILASNSCFYHFAMKRVGNTPEKPFFNTFFSIESFCGFFHFVIWGCIIKIFLTQSWAESKLRRGWQSSAKTDKSEAISQRRPELDKWVCVFLKYFIFSRLHSDASSQFLPLLYFLWMKTWQQTHHLKFSLHFFMFRSSTKSSPVVTSASIRCLTACSQS